MAAHTAEGWTLDPAHVFRDDDDSGATLARPSLDRPRDSIKGREVDRVLVTAPDQLARNYVHHMILLEEWVAFPRFHGSSARSVVDAAKCAAAWLAQ